METYNGWTNRETWCLMLWINNDEGLQSYAHEYVRDRVTQLQASAPVRAIFQGAAESLTYDAATALQEWTEIMFTRSGYEDQYGEQWPPDLADIAAEIGSLWRIDFRDAAESLWQDIREAV